MCCTTRNASDLLRTLHPPIAAFARAGGDVGDFAAVCLRQDDEQVALDLKLLDAPGALLLRPAPWPPVYLVSSPLSVADAVAAFRFAGAGEVYDGAAVLLYAIRAVACAMVGSPEATFVIQQARDGLAAVTAACAPRMSDGDAFQHTDGLLAIVESSGSWPAELAPAPSFFPFWCQGALRRRLRAMRAVAMCGAEEALPFDDYLQLMVVRAVAVNPRGEGLYMLKNNGLQPLREHNAEAEHFYMAQWKRPGQEAQQAEQEAEQEEEEEEEEEEEQEGGGAGGGAGSARASFSCVFCLTVPPYRPRWFVLRAKAAAP